MLVRQFVDDDLGCASYLVGDPGSGEAVVVDPAFAIEQYLDAADDAGVRIGGVLETHTHADHLSGHGRLALEQGVPVSIHPLAHPEYVFEPLEDGEPIHVGSVEIRVAHTPGHRPEHCAFVVDGELVLTGDSLFVGDAARPDLAIEARAGAADLHRSIRRLAELPDEVVVCPGHVAGSLCGANMSAEHASSIGRERRTNHALRSELADFVDESASLSTPRPPTTERLVALNRGPWVAALPPLDELEGPGEALVLDIRPVDVFAAGHVPGAISVALDGGSFATRAAFVLGVSEPVVLHVRSRVEAEEAARLLAAVGLFEARGWFTGAGAETTPTITVHELTAMLERGNVQLLDVRETSEQESHPLWGAIERPYRLLRDAPPAGLDTRLPVFTICASGARAMLAASLLARQELDARAVVGGGADDMPLHNATAVGSSDP
jgi:glyoxylase-like metal-dependent hydrolase (beta-lactamase superfamily II)/rhodanese-related sulfurtransferase